MSSFETSYQLLTTVPPCIPSVISVFPSAATSRPRRYGTIHPAPACAATKSKNMWFSSAGTTRSPLCRRNHLVSGT